MEPDDLLCLRNAREEKGSLVVLLLAERAQLECARSTRAVKGNLSLSLLSAGGPFVILLGNGIKATVLHQVQQLEGGARRTLLADLPLLHCRNACVQEAGKHRLADP